MRKAAERFEISEIDIKDTIERVFITFLQTAHAVQKYYDKELFLKADLSMPKHAVLHILEIHGGTMMPSTIADLMLVERHNMTTLVDRLNRDGLVKVERGMQRDRRVVHIILTDKGRQALKRAQPLNQRLSEKVMANIDDDTAESLEKVPRY